MSRLYDALKNAQTGLPKFDLEPVFHPPTLPKDDPVIRLLQAVDGCLPGRVRKVIQIVGCHGHSAVAERLAAAAASQRSAMLISTQAAGPPQPGQDEPTYIRAGLREYTGDAVTDPSRLRVAWDRLRLSYDLVVVDSPGIDDPLAQAIAPTVDGVVLIITAEKTLLSDGEAARDALIRRGANLIGVVLEDQCFHGPRWLRDRF